MCHDYGTLVFIDDNWSPSVGRILNWGVDGIQTDQPDRLIEYLNKRCQDKK
jgi:glycerophosphoryl diester phosphodiesterase